MALVTLDDRAFSAGFLTHQWRFSMGLFDKKFVENPLASRPAFTEFPENIFEAKFAKKRWKLQKCRHIGRISP